MACLLLVQALCQAVGTLIDVQALCQYDMAQYVLLQTSCHLLRHNTCNSKHHASMTWHDNCKERRGIPYTAYCIPCFGILYTIYCIMYKSPERETQSVSLATRHKFVTYVTPRHKNFFVLSVSMPYTGAMTYHRENKS